MTAGFRVASRSEVRASARIILRRHRRRFAGVVALDVAATAFGLAVPALIGALISRVQGGRGAGYLIALIVFFIVVQALLMRMGMYTGGRLAADVLARLREDFIDDVVALPLGEVERAGVGNSVRERNRRF